MFANEIAPLPASSLSVNTWIAVPNKSLVKQWDKEAMRVSFQNIYAGFRV